MTTDDERIAYLAGDGPGALDHIERSELDELKQTLSEPAVWAEPADGLEDAVIAAIAAEAAALPQVPVPARAASSQRSRWLRPRSVIGAAAAAVAIVVATAVIASDEPTRSQPLAATLEPTGLVPGARGRATFTRTNSGWRIQLDATGLPRLDAGRFYQAWLEGNDGSLVAVGSFNEGRGVVLWAGVSPGDHPRITITEETADGDAGSSGREVLVGPITDG
jgi:Anti-sigma-K factor rskA